MALETRRGSRGLTAPAGRTAVPQDHAGSGSLRAFSAPRDRGRLMADHALLDLLGAGRRCLESRNGRSGSTSGRARLDLSGAQLQGVDLRRARPSTGAIWRGLISREQTSAECVIRLRLMESSYLTDAYLIKRRSRWSESPGSEPARGRVPRRCRSARSGPGLGKPCSGARRRGELQRGPRVRQFGVGHRRGRGRAARPLDHAGRSGSRHRGRP